MPRPTCWVLLLFLLATTLSAQQTIFWKVDHIYANGKEVATVTPLPSDQTAPAAPSGLNYSNVTATSATLTWSASSDSGGSQLQGYKIYRQVGSGANLPVGTVNAATLSFTDPHLQPATPYYFSIRAFDGAQNLSAASNTVLLTTSNTVGDASAPSVPIGLNGRGLSATSIQLNWNASTDTGGSGVASYRVYRNGSLAGSPAANAYTDSSGLSPNTTYNYTVAAVDGIGNASAQSTSVPVSTKRTVVFSDDFNRADATSIQNSNWLPTLWGIAFNTAIFPRPNTGWNNALSTTTQTDFQAAARILHVPSPGNAGIHFWVDNTLGSYRAYLSGTSLILSFFDAQNNESLITSLQNAATTPGVLSVAGASASRNVKVFYNGQLKIDFNETNTGRPNGGRAGLSGYLQASSASDVLADDFLLEQ